jgi:hypothetical protein
MSQKIWEKSYGNMTSPKKVGRSPKKNILLPKKLGEVCKKKFSALSVIGKKMTSPNLL